MKGKYSQAWQRWLLCLLVLGLQAWAQTGQTQIAPPFTNVFSFTDDDDGANPRASLFQGKDGNFYSTTVVGGVYGHGVVFKLTSSGALTTLHSFANGSDGANPYAGLIQGTDGNFYGTTAWGGAYPPNFAGVVFKITPSGALTPLHSFTGADGGVPYAGLIQGKDGNFYGTTPFGGNNSGVVFKITPQGVLTDLYAFSAINPNTGVNAVIRREELSHYAPFKSEPHCSVGELIVPAY